MADPNADEHPVLYSFRRCPYAMRARLAIAACRLEVELREVVLRDKPAHLLEISPKGTVPVLWLPPNENGERQVIEESYAIMLWAVSELGPGGRDPLGLAKSPAQSRLLENNDGPFKKHLDRYKYPHRYEGVDAIEERDAAVSYLAEIDRTLGDSSYLGGDGPSLLDFALAPFVRQFANTDREFFDQAEFPRLQAWLAREIESERFEYVMTKYKPWQPGDAPVYFGNGTTA